MDHTERLTKIQTYGNAHAELVNALERFPREMWQYRPANGWSIHEIIVHIADSEANSYVRCRKAIVEPGAQVMAYDEEGWARALDYHASSPDDALELFMWLRRKSFKLIESLPDALWANTMQHPENGTMTLDDWLDVYARHIPEHISQMQTTYDAWEINR